MELAGSVLPDAPSWWSQGGAAGWSSQVWLGVGPPWALAGLALGGWSLVEPGRAPQGLPFPGVIAMNTPLVGYDSVEVSAGEGAAWRGFGATLATAYGLETGSVKGGRAMLDLRTGDFGLDENSLTIERGDSAFWFRGETFSGNRGEVAALDLAGRHLWGVAAGTRRGRHEISGSYAQRGAAAALWSGDEQDASGESGDVNYRYHASRYVLNLALARGHDHHDSFGTFEDIRPRSRRVAQEVVAAAEILQASERRDLGMRLEWRRARVSRVTEGAGFDSFNRHASALWAAARYERGLGDGRLRLEMGAGRHGGVDRFELAPGLSYHMRTSRFAGRVGFERLLYPVWTDVAIGQEPFLQRTWAGVLEVSAGRPGRELGASFLFGRTQDRALVARLPLEEEWLRLGALADPEEYDFALIMARAKWDGGRFGMGTDGFVLSRSAGVVQPWVDPNAGLRAWALGRLSAFQGDLRATLRAELEGVGERETQGGPFGFCDLEFVEPSRVLPAYLTSGATGIVEIKGAVVTARVRNLENRPREETWIDCTTGTEALGPGREWRFALTLRLFN